MLRCFLLDDALTAVNTAVLDLSVLFALESFSVGRREVAWVVVRRDLARKTRRRLSQRAGSE